MGPDARSALVSTTNATLAEIPVLDVVDEGKSKPRRHITKGTRRKEFKHWFGEWAEAYRARKVSHSEAKDDEDKTDYWRFEEVRKQHGTTYQTAEAFFDALQECVVAHRERTRAGGAVEVMDFYGAYSIVKQPRITEYARHEKVRERMCKMGFE